MSGRWSRRIGTVAAALLCVGASGAGAEPEVNPVVRAARALVASLQPAQRARMVRPFADREREDWHFVPRRRNGLALKDMTEGQRAKARALLRSALSKQGNEKVENVFKIETILRANLSAARRRTTDWRHPLLYHIAVYGTPATTGVWAWRIEGHHLSIHMTYENGKAIATTPLFIGTTIDHVTQGEHKGLRMLAHEDERARSLLASLNESQRAAAISSRPAGFALGPKGSPRSFVRGGLALAAMSPEQQSLFWTLVGTYFGTLAEPTARSTLAGARKTPSADVRFAWFGRNGPGERWGYRIASPSFAIDYFNDGGHIHAVWRDAANDFGRSKLTK